jgi:hypothetical protein
MAVSFANAHTNWRLIATADLDPPQSQVCEKAAKFNP